MRGDGGVRVLLHELLVVLDVLRTDTSLNRLADISIQRGSNLLRSDEQLVAAQVNIVVGAFLHQSSVQEVHLRAADEAADEHIARIIVQVLRSRCV